MKTRKTILMTILAMTFILSSQLVKAQFPIDSTTNQVRFTGIIDLPNMTKDVIYKKAKLWIVSTLKSGDNMVELNGSGSEQIVGTGNLLLDSIFMEYKSYAKTANLNLKFIIYCKDNKLKYSVENFTLIYSWVYSSASPALVSVQTGLEELKVPTYMSNKKDIKFFRERNTEYIKSKIEMLIANFMATMKREENNNW